MNTKELIQKLEQTGNLAHCEYAFLLSGFTRDDLRYAQDRAVSVAKQFFSSNIYIRGLIEFTNICKNDCLYCGLRCSNQRLERYRLSKDEILSCAKQGFDLGFRTFVLQGGEDIYFDDDKICDIVKSIKDKHPDCAVTLSIGERSPDSYKAFLKSGADRYLLRHETASSEHYQKLHPKNLTLKSRMDCLYSLKEAGFQTGCGFMVGSPYQTAEELADDMVFLQEFKPHMVGIGPFIPHSDTPFGDRPQGSLELTQFCIALVRLMLKNVLLPSTTALATISPNGHKSGILAGANVIMPNLSPQPVRDKYMLYDNKQHSGNEAAEGLRQLSLELKAIGYTITVDRGDFKERKL